MYTPTHKTSELVKKAHSIAQEVARVHAVDVDVKARFPQESIDAMKQATDAATATEIARTLARQRGGE